MRKWWNIIRIAVIISALSLSYNSGWAISQNSTADKERDRILSLALLANDASGNMRERARFEDAIDNIDKHGLKDDELMRLYIALLDYYIGESTGEVLSEKITAMGEKILPFLVEKKNSPVECTRKYKSLCSYKNQEERNVKIIRMITAIKQGRVLYAIFPKNLKAEHEKELEIIRIFIQDYRSRKGNLPNSLDTLREYTCHEYGYNLKIYSPWFGKPLKYLPQKDGKYVLEAGDDKP